MPSHRSHRTAVAATLAVLLLPGTSLAAASATDLDGDGLSNRTEKRIGTNPRKADTDRDGLRDGREVRLGTNPLKKDTDGDGMSDGYEVKTSHTDPLVADDLGTRTS